MYAIIQVGSRQEKVSKGDVIRVDKLKSKIGDSIIFDKVLLVADETKTLVGQPFINGAYVEAEIVEHLRDKKVLVFKYKRRKNYKKTYGHKQPYTKISIKNIKLQ